MERAGDSESKTAIQAYGADVCLAGGLDTCLISFWLWFSVSRCVMGEDRVAIFRKHVRGEALKMRMVSAVLIVVVCFRAYCFQVCPPMDRIGQTAAADALIHEIEMPRGRARSIQPRFQQMHGSIL
jgi:hypothetical protein